MLLLVSGATRFERTDDVGHFIVPGAWALPKTLNLQPRQWAMDNGAFGGAFDPGQFVTMLERFHPYHASQGYQGCLFVAAPDVIYKSGMGDAAATLAKWPFWSRLIRGLGFAPAFIAQDGLSPDRVPWNDLGALFIGGSTRYKESADVRSLMAYAKARGIWTHWGRVNGKRRYELAKKAGCDSFDGTGFSRHPDTNIPLVEDWDDAILKQPELTL
jgi:hypothetical protein